jgi:hypothetical protein
MAKSTSTKKRALDLNRVLTAIDQKNYNFYDNLTDQEKKEFSAFVMMRFISNSTGDQDIQEWFVEMTNEFVNKNFWDISKFPDLTWKLCSAVGVGATMRHQYLGTKKVELDKFENLLAEINPSMKLDDVQFLASLMDKEDRTELFDDLGFDKKERKKYV